MKSVCGLGTLS